MPYQRCCKSRETSMHIHSYKPMVDQDDVHVKLFFEKCFNDHKAVYLWIWPPSASTTSFRRPWNDQHMLTSYSFFMFFQCLVTEAFRTSTLRWQALQALDSTCQQILKFRGLRSGLCGGQKSLGQNFMFSAIHCWTELAIWAEAPSCWKT